MASIVEVVLLLCLFGLGYPRMRRYSSVIFLGSAWLVTVGEQVWATLQGFALPGIVSWTLVFLTLAALIPVRWPLHLTAQLGVGLYYFGVNYLYGLTPREPPVIDTLYALYPFWFCFICNLSVALYERLQRSEYEARKHLEAEQRKSDQLLLNVLPEPIAHKLRERRGPIADSFPDATVLFADVVGFTELSRSMTPVELVVTLNQLFSSFDQLVLLHGLEKIKTIGDSYMVVGGVPNPRVDHAEAVAEMALSMLIALERFNRLNELSFTMRVGINSGPVVAGVIGKQRCSYDLWGDTVNTASHMESYGLPNSIQVTAGTFALLNHGYEFTKRGPIAVKGKGTVETYLLVGRRASEGGF